MKGLARNHSTMEAVTWHLLRGQTSSHLPYTKHSKYIQCPLDIATLDIAAALPIATSTPVTNLRQYINSDLGYNDLKIQPLCSKIATVNPFEVAVFNGLCLFVLYFTIFKQIFFENSDRAAYSDLNPRDEPSSVHK